MTRRIAQLLALLLLVALSTPAISQDGEEFPMPDNYLSSDVATNEDQARDYLAGKAKYPSKPKDMWELGIHAGYFQVSGDVNQDPGFGVGLHLRKSLGYTFALRFNGMFAKGSGVNFAPETISAIDNLRTVNTGEDATGSTMSQLYGTGAGRRYFSNYKTTYIELATQGVITLNNLKFHKERNKVDLFLITGLGFNYYSTKINALNGDAPYAELTNIAAKHYNGTIDLNTRAGRREMRKEVKAALDDSWETNGEEWGYLFNLAGSDEDGDGVGGRINPIANFGLGIGYLLNRRTSITLEHQATFNDDDLIDGKRWRTSEDLTRDVDVPQYTNLRLNFHLGSFDKRVEPLWWLNPIDAPYAQLADLRSRPDNTEDSDGDGVIDILDKEPNTPPDCPVDTRGVTLDSDQDGVVDCKDKEPYSPPGCPVDAFGVAQCPEPESPWLTEDEIKKLIPPPSVQGPTTVVADGCSGDWFLPMIHFDLDKYRIKPEFYPQLHHVATVMTKCPNLTVVAEGHTDVRMPNDYNTMLAWERADAAINYLVTNYNIDRSRFMLMYRGENSPLIAGLPDNHVNNNLEKEKKQYMNRRVEFRVMTSGDSDMGRPNSGKIGDNTPRSSRPGKIYSGNPGSGY